MSNEGIRCNNEKDQIILLALRQISQPDREQKVVLEGGGMENTNTTNGQVRNDLAYRIIKIFQLEKLTSVSLCQFPSALPL